jgi:hypothetical protein
VIVNMHGRTTIKKVDAIFDCQMRSIFSKIILLKSEYHTFPAVRGSLFNMLTATFDTSTPSHPYDKPKTRHVAVGIRTNM